MRGPQAPAGTSAYPAGAQTRRRAGWSQCSFSATKTLTARDDAGRLGPDRKSTSTRPTRPPELGKAQTVIGVGGEHPASRSAQRPPRGQRPRKPPALGTPIMATSPTAYTQRVWRVRGSRDLLRPRPYHWPNHGSTVWGPGQVVGHLLAVKRQLRPSQELTRRPGTNAMSRSAKAATSARDVSGEGGTGLGRGITNEISQSSRMPRAEGSRAAATPPH